MSVARWLAAGAAALTLAVGSSSSQPLVSPALQNTDGVPIAGEVTNGVQTFVSNAVDGATTAVCEITDIETLCLLTIVSFKIATDYRRPNGTHVTKTTGALVNTPSVIDATGDGLPDVTVTIYALSPSHIRMHVQKLALAPHPFPVSVEAIVTDPTTDGRKINVGYDALATTAPGNWKALASLTTGTTTTVDATLKVLNAPSSLTVLGGLYIEGDGGARNNPKQARLTHTPVPDESTVNFQLAPASTTGAVSAVTKTKADLELTMLEGTSGQHVLGTLDKLQKPVSVLLDKVDANGDQTDGTTGDTHVRLSTAQDVAQSKLVYETITESQVLQRVRLGTSALPAQTDFTQTPTGFVVDTSSPISQVAGGVAAGVPADGGNPAIPVPAAYPLESAEASYVHQDTTAKVDSTTFRVAGVEHVEVSTTGPQDDRRIAIGARLASAPLHVLVTNDAQPGGTRYDADVMNLPHNFSIAVAPARKRVLEFCGSSNDADDPCGASGQAAPAGIDKIVLNDSYAPTPLFGEATHLNGLIEGIPSTLGLDLETHTPVDEFDLDQNTRVYIDTTRSIGRTILRATDGTPAPADPVDNGLVYLDTPAKYAVVAKVDGFRRAHLDTLPGMAMDLRAASGHDFSFLAELPTDDGPLHLDGVLRDRPFRTSFDLLSEEGSPTILSVAGETGAGLGAPHPKLEMNLVKPEPLFGEATHLSGEITDLPNSVDLVIDARGPEDANDPDQNTKVHVDASNPIGQVIVRATDGGAAPADPADNGVLYQDQAGSPYALIAKVDGFRSVHLDTKPKLDVTLSAAPGHDFTYGIHLPAETDEPGKDFSGVIEGRPAKTAFSFDDPEDGPLTVHAEGRNLTDTPASTGKITLDALHLTDDADEKIHNIRVELVGVPPALDLVKQPAADDAIDIDVTTTGGTLGIAEVTLDNDVLPDPADIPSLPAGGGGAIVFTGGDTFFMHALVKQLRSVSLQTAPEMSAALDVAEQQDFRIYLNTGVGDDYTVNVNDCDDFDPSQHNGAHEEFHDVFIKNLQPNTTFDYLSGDDGAGPCVSKGWRTIEYSANGRADSITYDTNVGDMAHLKTVVGQEGPNPLQVPQHLKVCQASSDECFTQLGKFRQCNFGGIDYDYCSFYSAETSVYLESFGEKTHASVNYCSLNQDASNFSTCTRAGTQNGVFVNLNFSHVDMGFHYDTGNGFLTVNSQKHLADGETDDGPNLGVTGFIRSINHNSIAEFVNLNFGWNGGNEWDASNPSTFDNSYGAFVVAIPLLGSHDGETNCVDPAYGPSWDESDSYFHVILDTLGNSEDDLGDNLTNLLCGLF